MSTAFKDVKPFPGQASQAAPVAPIGHNRPSPSVDADREFNDTIDQREGFRVKIEQLLAASDRAVCIDQDTAGRCADLGKQIAAAVKVVEDARKTVKEPYLEAGRTVDGVAKTLSVPLIKASDAVRGKIDTYLREERAKADAERRRQEGAQREAARVAAEQRAAAEAAGNPAPEPEPMPEPAPVVTESAPIRGDYGSMASARTVWKHEITDITVAFMAVENNEKVREAIDKAIGGLIRSGVRKIEGVRIYEDQAVTIR